MKISSIPFTHPAFLPVFQTKEQTKAFYNKISRGYPPAHPIFSAAFRALFDDAILR